MVGSGIEGVLVRFSDDDSMIHSAIEIITEFLTLMELYVWKAF